MLIKLDARAPQLFNPDTVVRNVTPRCPSWGVVTSDPKTENCIKGWLSESKHTPGRVWISAFSDCVYVDFCKLTMTDMFWLMQKLYWNFRYCSWALEAVSRRLGYPDWCDEMPSGIFEMRESLKLLPNQPMVLTKGE